MRALDRPFPASWTVRQGLDAYLLENGFTREGYYASTTQVSFLGLSFPIPNTEAHRKAIMRHDLHHVATGYGTDLVGETEISAWETAKGLSGVGLYVTFIVLGLTAMGATVAPRRVARAFRVAKGRGNLFQEEGYEALLDLTIGELRARLGVPPEGLVTKRALHAKAPHRA